MKKLSLVFLLIAAFALAQEEVTEEVSISAENFQPSISFGPKAGINVASIAGDYEDLDYVEKLEGMIGFHAGGWINYAFHPKMAVQAELLGSIQGGDIKYKDIENPISGDRISPTAEMRLPYIMLPIMFQYKPLENMYLEAGPQMNILFKVDFTAFVNGEEINDEDAQQLISNRLDNSRTLDLGLKIGAGYEFIEDFTFYGRYTHGLITVDARENNQRDLKNRVLQFGLAYTF